MRQPIGVCAAITPFNFPAMVPLWFLPFAVVSGNTFILKPSEQVPLSQKRMFELLEQVRPAAGRGQSGATAAREVVEAICDHPGIRAVSFVGSTPVARLVYQRGTHAGKRVQALGGAKNFIVVMPDADFDHSIPVITESFYGCAGERCLAGSVLLPVGEAHRPTRERLIDAARSLKVGDGLEPGVTMGPVISGKHRERVLGYVEKGDQRRRDSSRSTAGTARVEDRARRLLRRARRCSTKSRRRWSSATRRSSDRWRRCARVKDLDEAFRIMDAHPNANATSIFTSSGKAAREFAHRATASMVGVNIGVAAPMSYFPFGGARDSFFGDLKVHGRDAFEFYTDKKVTISRWF